MLVKINVRAGSLNARHVRAPTLGQLVTNALASDSSSGKLLIGLQADNTQKFSIWQLNKPIVRARDAQPRLFGRRRNGSRKNLCERRWNFFIILFYYTHRTLSHFIVFGRNLFSAAAHR